MLVAAALTVSVAGPAMAAEKYGWKTGCSTDSPVAVQAHTTGNGYIRTYDANGNNNNYDNFSGSSGTYLFHYGASNYLAAANWHVVTNGAIDSPNTYAYCAS
ncbi:MAG: hypothetical protein ABJB03_01745 [Rhodoglobus sp.]